MRTIRRFASSGAFAVGFWMLERLGFLTCTTVSVLSWERLSYTRTHLGNVNGTVFALSPASVLGIDPS